jgi:CheY-like chemotaxis protein
LTVESELQKGSRFSFTARFGLAQRVISPSTRLDLSLVGYRVLIVDDNHINRLIARELAASCGAEVTEASSGEEALVALHRAAEEGRPYRIVLLDLRMPLMDGFEVAERIRDEHLPMAPLILMLSSDHLKPQISRLQQLGLSAYLVKPITRKELTEAIRRVIDHASREAADFPSEPMMPMREADAAVKTVLVAEDSPDNRLVIAAYLRQEPYQVDFAEDGKEALGKFIAHQYDLVLMDIQMPVMDGLEATRAIRQWEQEHHRAPATIIALTAFALEEDVKRVLAAGCNMHLSKPIKKTTLVDCIRTNSGAGHTGISWNPNGKLPLLSRAAALDPN